VFGWQTSDDNTPTLWLDDGQQIAYTQIKAFRPHTDETVADLLKNQAPHVKGLVLDLRGNGGGDVQAAANVVDLFVGEGLVGSLSGRNIKPQAPTIDESGNRMAMWNEMLPGDLWEGLPVVVLIDARTASAAELVAAALHHHADAWIFGETSLGKGWSQGLFLDETHGFALQLTNAEWRRPDGAMVHREPGSESWGVTPDLIWTASAAEDWQRGQQQHVAVHPRTHLDGTPMFVAPVDSGLPLLNEDPLLLLAEMALWSRIAE
ncbi:MAG: hypothetical protein GWP91_03655, partial [Rhodobacterales bacterium]|nr:hypothetical protein [Rhodobacterales bacterium]